MPTQQPRPGSFFLLKLGGKESVGVFKEGYDAFTQVVDAMLRGGFTPAEAAKIVGGNYLRIFAASTS